MKKFLSLLVGITLFSVTSVALGYSMSCSGYPGCNQCFGFELAQSNTSYDSFVPRSGLLSGQQEQIDLSQSAITAQTYQGATVTPTGSITSYFALNGGPSASSWTWANMTNGSIQRGTIPSNIDYNQPVYGIKFVTQSYVVDSNGKIAGTDVTHTECAYFFAPEPACQNAQTGSANNATFTTLSASSSGLCSVGTVTNFASSTTGWTWTCQAASGCNNATGRAYLASTCQNAQTGSANNATFTTLSASSSGLCSVGTVTNFASSTTGWTWTCQAASGCNNATGRAYLASTPVDNTCTILAEPTSGTVPFTSSFLCRGSSSSQNPLIIIQSGGDVLDSFQSSSQSYTFQRYGNYTVTCYPDTNNRDNSCRTSVSVFGECGNGILEDGEQCDDGDLISGDGCSRACRIEEPENNPICGNGILEDGEQCDDGNSDDGDMCTSICQSQTPSTGSNLIVLLLIVISITGSFIYSRRQYDLQ